MKKIFLAVICAAALYSGYVYARGAKMITTSDQQEEITFAPKTKGGKSDKTKAENIARDKCMKQGYNYGAGGIKCSQGQKAVGQCPHTYKTTDANGNEKTTQLPLYKECLCDDNKYVETTESCIKAGGEFSGEKCTDKRGERAEKCGCSQENIVSLNYNEICTKYCEINDTKACLEKKKCANNQNADQTANVCVCRDQATGYVSGKHACTDLCQDDLGNKNCITYDTCDEGEVVVGSACVKQCNATQIECETNCYEISHTVNGTSLYDQCVATEGKDVICGNFKCDTSSGQVCNRANETGEGKCICNTFTNASNATDCHAPEGCGNVTQYIYTSCGIYNTEYASTNIDICRENRTIYFSNCTPDLSKLFKCEANEKIKGGAGNKYDITELQNNSLVDTKTTTYWTSCACADGYTWNAENGTCVENNCEGYDHLCSSQKNAYLQSDPGCIKSDGLTYYKEGCNCGAIEYWDTDSNACRQMPNNSTLAICTEVSDGGSPIQGNNCFLCDAGYVKDGHDCKACPIGTYKEYQDDKDNTKGCIDCGEGYTTQNTASSSIDACKKCAITNYEQVSKWSIETRCQAIECNEGYVAANGGCVKYGCEATEGCAADGNTGNCKCSVKTGTYYADASDNITLLETKEICTEVGTDSEGKPDQCLQKLIVGTRYDTPNDLINGLQESACKVLVLNTDTKQLTEETYPEYVANHQDASNYKLLGGSKYEQTGSIKKVNVSGSGVTEDIITFGTCKPLNENICQADGKYTSDNCQSIEAQAILKHPFYKSSPNGDLTECLTGVYATCECSVTNVTECTAGSNLYKTCKVENSIYQGCRTTSGCLDTCKYHENNLEGTAKPSNPCANGKCEDENGYILHLDYYCENANKFNTCNSGSQVARASGYYITTKSDGTTEKTAVCYTCEKCNNLDNASVIADKNCDKGEDACSCVIGACYAGYYVKANEDWDPNSKEFQDFNTCEICPKGHYCTPNTSVAGNTGLNKCGIGQYQDEEGQTSCKTCPTGSTNTKEGAEDITSCLCPAGFYRPTNGFESTGCLPCENGHYCPTEGTVESEMTPQNTDADTFVMIACPKGTYAVKDNSNGTQVCTACPAGTYQDETGKSECKVCKEGTFCPEPVANGENTETTDFGEPFGEITGNSLPTICGQDNYCPAPEEGATIGNIEATSCPEGSHTATGVKNAVSLDECLNNDGYAWIAADNQAPVPCPAGTYCKAEQHTRHNITAPTPCPAGTFQDKEGQEKCEICGEGHYCPAPQEGATAGATTQTDCPKGHGCPKPNQATGAVNNGFGYGNAEPTICKAGTFQNKIGQSACIPCGEGEFVGFVCPEDGITSKPPHCPAGTAANETHTDCVTCDNGEYQDQEKQTSCKPCDKGSYCPDYNGQEYHYDLVWQDRDGQNQSNAIERGVTTPTSCGDGATTAGTGAKTINECICNAGDEYKFTNQNCYDGATLGEENVTCSINGSNNIWHKECSCPTGYSQPTASDKKEGQFRTHYSGIRNDDEFNTPQFCFKWESCPTNTTLEPDTNDRYPVITDCKAPAGKFMVIENSQVDLIANHGFQPAVFDCPAGFACPKGSYVVINATVNCNITNYQTALNIANATGNIPCPETPGEFLVSYNAQSGTDVGMPVLRDSTDYFPIRCAPGTAPNADKSACEICPAGTYSENGFECTPCGAGTYCPAPEEGASAGNTAPTPCPDAHFCPDPTDQTISAEAKANIKNGGNSAPTTCPAGYWCPGEGIEKPKACNTLADDPSNSRSKEAFFGHLMDDSSIINTTFRPTYYYCPTGTGITNREERKCPSGTDPDANEYASSYPWTDETLTDTAIMAAAVDELRDCKTPKGWYAVNNNGVTSLSFCSAWSMKTDTKQVSGGHYCPGGVSVTATDDKGYAGRNACPTNSATVANKTFKWQLCEPYHNHYFDQSQLNSDTAPDSALTCDGDDVVYNNGHCGYQANGTIIGRKVPGNDSLVVSINIEEVASLSDTVLYDSDGYTCDKVQAKTEGYQRTKYVKAKGDCKNLLVTGSSYGATTVRYAIPSYIPTISQFGYNGNSSNGGTIWLKWKSSGNDNKLGSYYYRTSSYYGCSDIWTGYKAQYWTAKGDDSGRDYYRRNNDKGGRILCVYSQVPACLSNNDNGIPDMSSGAVNSPFTFRTDAPLSKACVQYSSGNYSLSTGESPKSDKCSAGHYRKDDKCHACTPGTYIAEDEHKKTSCTVCPKGTYASAYGSSSCQACPAGSFASGTSNTECKPCAEGRSTNGRTGQTSCTACAGGYIAPETGTAQCSPCQEGYESNSNNTQCTECGSGTCSRGGQMCYNYKVQMVSNMSSSITNGSISTTCKVTCDSGYKYNKSLKTCETQSAGSGSDTSTADVMSCSGFTNEAACTEGYTATGYLKCTWCTITSDDYELGNVVGGQGTDFCSSSHDCYKTLDPTTHTYGVGVSK